MGDLRVQGARRRRAPSTRGEIEADDKQVVASQLRSRGPDRPRHRGAEERPTSATSSPASRRSRPQDLTVATRQLSTMVSSGMSLLRALYVLEEQTENDKLRDAFIGGAQGRRGRASRCPTALRAPPRRSSTTSTSRWSTAGESGGILESTLQRVADQLEKDDSLQAPGQVGDDVPDADRRLRGDRSCSRSSPSSSPSSRRSSRTSAASCRRSPSSPSGCRTSSRSVGTC